MTYQETIDYLYRQLPMYQRDGKSAYKKDLANTIALLDLLDNPHNKFKSVHIAGTNGKGSSAHGIASILQHSNLKTGLYTSPHLKSFTERIKINGEEIEEKSVVSFVETNKIHIEKVKPSFFELTVAMAFDHFAKNEVDIAVIETGLGGRLDSTNVITPEVSLITNIGFDHQVMLGNTLVEIAGEKAGIIKHGIPVVIGTIQKEVLPVFERKAKELAAPMTLSFDFPDLVDESPYYKQANWPGVYNTVQVLKDLGWEITDDITGAYDQLEEATGFKGRLQKLNSSPDVIADVSHNQDGLNKLFEYLKTKDYNEFHLIFGSVKDKDLEPILEIIGIANHFYWTQSNVPRSLSVSTLYDLAKEKGILGTSFLDVNKAIDAARERAQDQDLILVTGSTFIVAEVQGL